jgi:hypothetical protein
MSSHEVLWFLYAAPTALFATGALVYYVASR